MKEEKDVIVFSPTNYENEFLNDIKRNRHSGFKKLFEPFIPLSMIKEDPDQPRIIGSSFLTIPRSVFWVKVFN